MENEGNNIELTEEHLTEEEELDLPPKVKKLFNMEDY